MLPLSPAVVILCFFVHLSLTTPIFNPDGSVDIPVSSNDSFVKRNVKLDAWTSCEGNQKAEIIQAWDEMLKMSGWVNGRIAWDESVSAG